MSPGRSTILTDSPAANNIIKIGNKFAVLVNIYYSAVCIS